MWDNGTLKPSPSTAHADEAASAAVEAEDSYDDSFDDAAGESGNGSEEDGAGGEGTEHDLDHVLAAQETQFQAPPASMQPLYDVTSSHFVVHVQQQPSGSGVGEKLQGPNRPVKVKKTTTPSFIGLKLRLKVWKQRNYLTRSLHWLL